MLDSRLLGSKTLVSGLQDLGSRTLAAGMLGSRMLSSGMLFQDAGRHTLSRSLVKLLQLGIKARAQFLCSIYRNSLISQLKMGSILMSSLSC